MKRLLTIIIFGLNLILLANAQERNSMDGLKSTIDSLFNELKYNEAAPYIDAMGTLVSKANDKYYSVLWEYYEGSCLCVNSNFKDGFAKLNEAQNNVQKLPDSDKKTALGIRIKLALSGCFISCDMLSEALVQLQEGIEENERFGDENLQIKLDNNLAALYSLMGKRDESTTIYKKMLQPGDYRCKRQGSFGVRGTYPQNSC